MTLYYNATGGTPNLVDTLGNLMAISTADTNFQEILPNIIDYAELRIQRDLDLLATITTTTALTTLNNRSVTLPSQIEVVQELNVIVPAGTTNPENGTRVPLTPVAKEYLNSVWTSASGHGVPTLFAMLNTTTMLVGPWPDDAYTIEIVGTTRATPLSTANQSNYLSMQLSDIYIAAAMIFASGWMRNFGAQMDNPQMAMSWETQYQNLLKSATVEEFRRKFQASAWSSMSPAVVATPTR
jgi:hypothetical protein